MLREQNSKGMYSCDNLGHLANLGIRWIEAEQGTLVRVAIKLLVTASGDGLGAGLCNHFGGKSVTSFSHGT